MKDAFNLDINSDIWHDLAQHSTGENAPPPYIAQLQLPVELHLTSPVATTQQDTKPNVSDEEAKLILDDSSSNSELEMIVRRMRFANCLNPTRLQTTMKYTPANSIWNPLNLQLTLLTP